MEIKKNYDVKELAGKLKGRIKISNESDTMFVDIDMLTALGILDVLEEIGRMEKEGNKGKTVIDRLSPASPLQDGNKKALENLKNGCDDKPECYGKYSLGSTETRECVKCSCERECFIKSRIKKCFGVYNSLHPSVCANCEYACECKEETRGKGNA